MPTIEKQIADRIAKANGLSVTKLGLRFDKVVIRLLGNLRDYVERTSLKKETVIMTITAPIRLAVKTEYELEGRIKDFLDSGNRSRDRRLTIFQNEVRLRIVGSSLNQPPKFVGLVHNPGTDSKLLLDLASRWLLKS
jgi:hypothetical protein